MAELIELIAENTGVDESTVYDVVGELMLQLHRRFVEFKGDVIGEYLPHELGEQGFFHLIGLLEEFNELYDWEAGIASEYLLRLGGRARWLPYRHQMEAWERRADSSKSEAKPENDDA